MGIGLEGFPYPHPVSMLTLSEDDDALRMAYMDVKPSGAGNGRSVLLLHGRNFPSSYWDTVITALTGAGYRVVVPDQVGFGKSSKPLFALSFDMLAAHTIKLLDHLQIARADIVAHSMGGMLTVRIARSYPTRVDRIVLEAPIGLEDYRNFAPPVETSRIMAHEDRLTAEGYRTQLMTNYSLTLPPEAITPFIEARMRIKGSAEYPRWLRVLRQFLPDDLEPAGRLRDPAGATARSCSSWAATTAMRRDAGLRRWNSARAWATTRGSRASSPAACPTARSRSTTASAISFTWKPSSVSTPRSSSFLNAPR